jgi:hypothetical protein
MRLSGFVRAKAEFCATNSNNTRVFKLDRYEALPHFVDQSSSVSERGQQTYEDAIFWKTTNESVLQNEPGL